MSFQGVPDVNLCQKKLISFLIFPSIAYANYISTASPLTRAVCFTLLSIPTHIILFSHKVLTFTAVSVYIYCRQCLHLLPSVLTFTAVSAYIYCRQCLQLLSSVLTFTVVSAFTYRSQSLHLLSSEITCTVVSAFTYCRQSLHILSSEITCTVISAFIYCRQSLHLLSSVLAFTVIRDWMYCRQSLHLLRLCLHLLSSELTCTVIRAYISSHMKLATTSHYSNLRIFGLMHLETITVWVSFNVLLWYSAISRNTSTEDR